MRTFTFKGLFLIAVFMLLGCSSLYAADDDLITKQITIKLDKAGTLPDRISASKKYLITNLKIIGEINGTDLRMIRDMAGRNYEGRLTEGKLSVLDLSEAKIVAGGYYYYDNISFTNYKLYTSNDVIGEFAFRDCTGLTSLNLPAGITEIGENAFEDCTGLTSLNLHAGITEIGGRAFYGCSGLTSLKLPAGITEIGGRAFENCTGLTSLNLPDGITEIGESAFENCTGLTSLNLPDGITTIGSSAFVYCSGLTSLTLPYGITSIGSGAFRGCSGLKEVRFCINDNLDTYLTKGHPYINVACGIKYYINDKEITSIVIPSSVTSLGNYAFQKCSTLESIYVSWPIPISAGSAFYDVDRKNCTLYVPQGTETDYFLADVWGDFENIVEFDATDIDKTTTSTNVEEVSRYSVNGQRLVGPTKGLNIVKYSDGSVKKVAVQ